MGLKCLLRAPVLRRRDPAPELKNFCPRRVPELWPRLPREAGESPSLEIFQPRLAAVLCPLLWVTLLGQGVGLGDPHGSLPTPTML